LQAEVHFMKGNLGFCKPLKQLILIILVLYFSMQVLIGTNHRIEAVKGGGTLLRNGTIAESDWLW